MVMHDVTTTNRNIDNYIRATPKQMLGRPMMSMTKI